MPVDYLNQASTDMTQVRMWDIRRAGCIALLDQHASQRSAALPVMPMADDWCTVPAGCGLHQSCDAIFQIGLLTLTSSCLTLSCLPQAKHCGAQR